MAMSSKIGTLAILLLLLSACAVALKKAPPSLTTSADTSTPIATPKSTRVPRPTPTHTPIPTVYGVPVTEYQLIPIPGDAVAGMEDNGGYKFTSRQTIIDIASYYQQILPSKGWELHGTPGIETMGDDTMYICMTFSQLDSPWSAQICASRGKNDELTYVRIDLLNTD